MTAEDLEAMYSQAISELWLLRCMPVAELKVHVTEMLCYSVRQRVACCALVVYVPSPTQSTCISDW